MQSASQHAPFHATVTLFNHGDEYSYSIAYFKLGTRHGWGGKPFLRTTGRLQLPRSADPTTALRELLRRLTTH